MLHFHQLNFRLLDPTVLKNEIKGQATINRHIRGLSVSFPWGSPSFLIECKVCLITGTGPSFSYPSFYLNIHMKRAVWLLTSFTTGIEGSFIPYTYIYLYAVLRVGFAFVLKSDFSPKCSSLSLKSICAFFFLSFVNLTVLSRMISYFHLQKEAVLEYLHLMSFMLTIEI